MAAIADELVDDAGSQPPALFGRIVKGRVDEIRSRHRPDSDAEELERQRQLEGDPVDRSRHGDAQHVHLARPAARRIVVGRHRRPSRHASTRSSQRRPAVRRAPGRRIDRSRVVGTERASGSRDRRPHRRRDALQRATRRHAVRNLGRRPGSGRDDAALLLRGRPAGPHRGARRPDRPTLRRTAHCRPKAAPVARSDVLDLRPPTLQGAVLGVPDPPRGLVDPRRQDGVVQPDAPLRGPSPPGARGRVESRHRRSAPRDVDEARRHRVVDRHRPQSTTRAWRRRSV